MRIWSKGLLATGLLAGCVMGGALMASAADEPENLIKYRKATMSAIGGHMGTLVAVAKGEVSFTDDAEGHAHAINQMSRQLARLFPEGTSNANHDTRALPAIWEKWDDFEAAIKTLQEESAKLVEVAKTGDQAAIGKQVGEMGKQGCGGCHDTFREKE